MLIQIILQNVLNGNNLKKHVEILTSTIHQHEDPESGTGKTNNSDDAIIANNARKQSKQVENSTIIDTDTMCPLQLHPQEPAYQGGQAPLQAGRIQFQGGI